MPRPTVDEWRTWVEQAHRYRQVFGRSDDWPTYRAYYRGDFSGFNHSAEGVLPYNIVYSIYELLEPSLYLTDPFISVTKRGLWKPGMDVAAQIMTCIDNWLMSELNISSAVRMAIKHAYFSNRGILKVGYDSEFGYSADEQITGTDMTASQVSKKGDALEYNINIKPGMPWIVAVDPDFFLLNFGARSLDDCIWVDHINIRRLSDVQNDRRYKGTHDLTGSHVDKAMLLKNKSVLLEELEKDADLLELHEIRDAKRREVLVIAAGGSLSGQERLGDKIIYGPDDDPLQIEGIPYVDICFNVDPEYYWGPSDVRLIEPQQIELNETVTQTVKHRRIALLKFLYSKNALSHDELDKMLSENVGPAVEVNAANVQAAVAILQPHIPIDLTQWPDLIRSSVRELLGISRQRAGDLPPGRRTATEVEVSEFGHNLRMSSRRQVVARALERLLRKVNQIILTFWDKKRIVEVVGADAMRYWVEFSPEALKLEYNMKVDIEGQLPSSKQQRRQDIIQLIQALGNNPNINITYLLQVLLREFDWLDATQLFPSAPEMGAGKPMGMGDFMGQQQSLMSRPDQLGARRSAATQGMPAMLAAGGREA